MAFSSSLVALFLFGRQSARDDNATLRMNQQNLKGWDALLSALTTLVLSTHEPEQGPSTGAS